MRIILSCSTYLAPDIPISIMENQSPVALRDCILTCIATPPSSLEVTSPSYQWRRNGQVVPNQNNRQLNFSSLSLTEDGAQYTCQYTASSVYVNNVDVTSSTHTITLTRKYNKSSNTSSSISTIILLMSAQLIIDCI